MQTGRRATNRRYAQIDRHRWETPVGTEPMAAEYYRNAESGAAFARYKNGTRKLGVDENVIEVSLFRR